MSGHIFVSYSRADTAYVKQLVAFLRGAGLPVWTDEGIDVGTQWVDAVRGQVDTCAAFLPVMSPSSATSIWVAREMERAEALGKPVLPLLLAGDPFDNARAVQYEPVAGDAMPSARFVERLRTVLQTPAGPPAQSSATVAHRLTRIQLAFLLLMLPAAITFLVFGGNLTLGREAAIRTIMTGVPGMTILLTIVSMVMQQITAVRIIGLVFGVAIVPAYMAHLALLQNICLVGFLACTLIDLVLTYLRRARLSFGAGR